MDAVKFEQLLRERHAEVIDEIDLHEQPNTTMNAAALTRLTQGGIDQGNDELVAECFKTALEAWDNGDERVQNSIGLSYLRQLNFQDGRSQRSWAWQLLHPRLQEVVTTLEPDGARPPERSD